MTFGPRGGRARPDIAGQLNALSAILANINAQKQQAFQERKRRELAEEREETRKEEVAKRLTLDTKLIKAQINRAKAGEALAEFQLGEAMEVAEEADVTAGLAGQFFAGTPGPVTGLADPRAGAQRLLEGVGPGGGPVGNVQQLLQNIGPAVGAAGVTRGPAQRQAFPEFAQAQLAEGVAPEAIGRLGEALGPTFTTPKTTAQMFDEATALAKGGAPLPDRLSQFQPMWDRVQELNRIEIANATKDSIIKDIQIELLAKESGAFGKNRTTTGATSPAKAYREAIDTIALARANNVAPPQWAVDIVGGQLNPEGNTDFKVGLLNQLKRSGELGADALASEATNIIAGLRQGFTDGSIAKDEILNIANWAGIATLNKPINEILEDLEAKFIDLGEFKKREAAKEKKDLLAPLSKIGAIRFP